MADEQRHPLPRRVIGANLSADSRLNAVAAGRAHVEYPPGGRWSNDEKSMRILLNGLRRWRPTAPGRPDSDDDTA